jgi:hypothetical protein
MITKEEDEEETEDQDCETLGAERDSNEQGAEGSPQKEQRTRWSVPAVPEYVVFGAFQEFPSLG